MNLWTDYEGRTIADAYTLEKLVRSEGRNGFFSTADKKGHKAIIRLTETHFDDDLQIQRWKQVAAVRQKNLIEIERVGKTTVEGVALTFALMEPDDANLGDVLRERPLTTAETLEVARAVASALLSLHSSGLVHGHVEPANVMAVGEEVKLRSDCVRECRVDGEFISAEGCAALRQADVRAFGELLLRCLTQEKDLQPGVKLPEPFYRLIPGALDGSMTLEQMQQVLQPSAPKAAEPSPATVAAASAVAEPGALEASKPVAKVADTVGGPVADAAVAQRFRPRNVVRVQDESEGMQLPAKRWLIAGSAVLLVVIVGLWLMLSSKPKAAAVVAPAAVAVPSPAPAPAAAAAPVAPVVVQQSPAVPAVVPGWRVIAYTYNHADQAQAKVKSLMAKHAGLNPQVFSKSEHAPYYVALGGPMSERDAAELRGKALRSGMPRDTLIRKF